MESANSHHHHHHHQLQDQLVGSSSSPASSSSCFELGTTTHAWSTPFSSILSNNNGFITSCPSSDTILNSREITRQLQQDQNPHHHHQLSSQYSSTMPPDLGFYWSNNDHNFVATNHHQSLQGNLQNSRIKEELSSDHYYRNYVDILSSSTSPSSRNNNHTTADDSSLMQRNDIDEQSNDYLGTKLLLKSFSSGNLMNKSNAQISPQDMYANYNSGANVNGRGFSSQIFPSVNVSSLSSQNGFTNPSSLDMNLEALDLLTSSRFSGEFGGASQNQTGFLRDGGFSYGFDHHMQQQSSRQTTPFYGSNTTSKVSSVSSNGVIETKRSNSSRIEPKAPNAPKKSRLEARASCPPFKVRKEKLGDRVAALQQLVAPFGKTDTASVLMEAIGYIKFLQSQVETLSVPYMKASRNKSSRVMKGGQIENENEEQRRDLKSRGLCLVPLSCLSYMTDGDGGAAVWPAPHFGGAT